MSHSNIGASSCNRWWNCPGSVRFIEQFAPSEPTSYAAEGSVAHGLCERMLKGQLNRNSLIRMEGEIIQYSSFEIVVDREMIDSVLVYYDYVTSKLEEAGPGAKLYVEARVKLDDIDPRAFGTIDAAIVAPGKADIIVDYKHGKGIAVDIEGNKQLKYYAIGARKLARKATGNGAALIAIVQPRAAHAAGPIREYHVSSDELTEFAKGLIKHIAATREDNAPKVSGEWCRFCPGKSVCPAMLKSISKIAQTEFDVVPDGISGPPPVDMLTNEQLANILKWADAITDWLSAVKAKAQTNLETGIDVPGFKLVAGRSNRQWLSEDSVIEAFEPVLGEDIYVKKLKSPAQLEKLVGKNAIVAHTVKPDAPRHVAPVSDPRPALPGSAKSDFNAIL